ncbi:uncharacterized protein LOC134660674 [Cydia amplana]|uniref:uncharacterized protein LOC134660674 n=1 Tax=Cydia amplana TaxID=1869771 RepID=UPI002FE514BC
MDSKHNVENPPRYDLDSKEKNGIQRVATKTPSLTTLINWNISKALKSNPRIDLKVALREAEERLDEAHDANALVSPDARNFCCALLAWQQLGHRTADSLFKACGLDKKCMERLASMETETQELSKRAGQFARREARRSEQLERAEMAWRDLDACYQRRLRVAKEKEEEYQKQMARVLDERNKYKQACMPLVDALKRKSSVAEKEQEKLKELEKEMCARACARVRLAENAARVNAQLTEQQCKCSQLDRNLAWKEEHERSKQRALEDAAEMAKVLTHEAECAQRAELEALRKQVAQASQDLLEEDARTALLNKRIEDYMQEKNEMIEDLESCQTKCEDRMGALVKDLKCKRDKLAELKDKIMECRCKEPVDQAVEVKRTPSLAALCRCSPSDTIQGSCSCTSIRSRLLSSLLKDLFNGLKSEMDTIGSQMPCHLLKCLEDKHNWDQTTHAKQNVRAYFSRLLLGELDIAIATVIERSHAQWVGECCVDMKPQVSRDSRHSLRWQEHERETKTQKLANQLAEKMFQERAKELAKQAQQELQDSRPPCECDLNDTAHSSDNTGRKYVNNRRPELISTNKGNACKPATTRRALNMTARKLKSCTNKANPFKAGENRPNKLFRESQQYAVNMCLCDNKKKSTSNKPDKNFNMKSELCHSYSVSNLRQQKPILDFRENSFQGSGKSSSSLCTKTCACLHKTPSNTSIDRLVRVLTKWKDNLLESRDCNIQEIINTNSLFKITHSSIVNIIQEIHNKTDQTERKNSKTTLEKCAETQQHDKNVKSLKDSEKTLDEEDDCPKAIVSSQMKLKPSKLLSANQKSYKKHHRGNLFADKRGNCYDKFDDKLVKNNNRDIRKTRYAINRIKALNVLHVHNECVYPRTKVGNLNEEKSVEVQNNSNDVLSPDEPCVCCPITKVDNTSDLEVNAFQLLEEHLKSKLDEFRSLACKSTCIPNADEKCILNDTIVKVKKLILESANKVTCKCSRNNQSCNGSWNRAYSLLHEYLKTKIEHIECICSSVEYGQDENLVTRILSQISCLIENDLQRLKNMCSNCNDTTLDTSSKRESYIKHEPQCSISDLKNHNNSIITNAIEKNNMPITQVVESKFVSYTNGISLPHNKSAQVLLHHSVETKSCDAIKMYSKYCEVQTLDVMKKKVVIDNYVNSESYDVKPITNQQYDDTSTQKAEKKSNLHPDMQNNGLTKDTTSFQKRDITVLPVVMSPGNNINENGSMKNNLIDDQLLDEKKKIHVVNEDDKFDEQFLANIGCTINCCCDRDLGCVCTKSTVTSNTEWLRTNYIFKTFTQKQSVVESVSYILKSVPNKIPNNVNSIEDHSEDVHLTIKNQINDLNRRESNVEGNIYFGRDKQIVHVDYKAELVHKSKTRVCDSEVNASEENHICLKQSNQRFNIIHDSANTLTDESSLQFKFVPPKSKHHDILKPNAHELFKHVPMSFSNSDTALITDHESQRSASLSTDCDCAMVPICHVKMLVENIGSRLAKAECTCDSLKSVCPIHS